MTMSLEVSRPLGGKQRLRAFVKATSVSRSHFQLQRGIRLPLVRPVFKLKAEPESEIGACDLFVTDRKLSGSHFFSDPKTFDEGAAQVRRLMNRDRVEYSGPDFEALLENQFASEKTEDVTIEQPDSEEPKRSADDIKPVSPFGSASKKAVNPFDSPMKADDILAEAEALDKDVEPWWSFINNITVTQIVGV